MILDDIAAIYWRLIADHKAEPLQVTFDPKTPEVTRVHLVPLKIRLFRRDPSLVLINGWYSFMVGPSWSDLLRAFILALQEKAMPGKRLTRPELEVVLNSVMERMHPLYPSVPEDEINEDLNDIVSLCIAISHGQEVPQEIQAEVSFMELARRLKAPLRIDLLVTPMVEAGAWVCPLHCKVCYAASQPAMTIDKSLSTEQWKSIIDKCRKACIPQITFTGGEPTERADLLELVKYARWHITRLNTNGVNLNISYARELFDADLDGIQLTLYSHDSKVHDDLVGRQGAWQKTVRGIKNALKARLSVNVNTPLVGQNSDYTSTLEFIHELGVKYATCSGLIPAGAASAYMKLDSALTNTALMEVLRKAVRTARKLNMELMFTSPGWLAQEQVRELELSEPICGACFSNMAVMPNGAVTACQSWLNNPYGFGNLLSTPWSDIWNDQFCRRMRFTTQTGCPLHELEQGDEVHR